MQAVLLLLLLHGHQTDAGSGAVNQPQQAADNGLIIRLHGPSPLFSAEWHMQIYSTHKKTGPPVLKNNKMTFYTFYNSFI